MKKIISLLLAISLLISCSDIALALAPASRFKPIVDVGSEDGKISITVNSDASQTGLDPAYKNDASFLYLSQTISQALYLNLSDPELTDFRLEMEKKCSHLLDPEVYNYRGMYLGEDGAIYLPFRHKENGVHSLLRYFKPDKGAEPPADHGILNVSLDTEKPVWVETIGSGAKTEISAVGIIGNDGEKLSSYVSGKSHSTNDAVKPREQFSLSRIRKLIAESGVVCSLGDLAVPAGRSEASDYARMLSSNGFLTGAIARLITTSKKNGLINFIYGSTYHVYEQSMENDPDIEAWLDKAVEVFDEKIDKIMQNDNVEAVLLEFCEEHIRKEPIPNTADVYTLSKMLGERFANRPKNSVIIRMADPYGIGDHQSKDRISTLIKERLAGQKSTSPAAGMNYIHYNDLFEMIERLINTGKDGHSVVDLAGGETISAQRLKDLLYEHIPESLGKIEIVNDGSRTTEPDTGKSRMLLGRDFTPFEEGLSAYIRSYRADLKTQKILRLPGTIVREFNTGGSAAEVFLIRKPNGQMSIVKCATIEGVDANGMEKLKGEYEQFEYIRSRVPAGVRDRWAGTLAFNDFRPEGFNMTYMEMPLYEKAESLADFLLRPDRNMDRFSRILNSVLAMLFDNVYYEDITRAPENSIEKFYLARVERRVKVLNEKDGFLKCLTEAEFLTINGVRYHNVLPMIRAIRQNRELYDSLKPAILSLSPHGDLLINNVLLMHPDDAEDDDYVICDVRGEGTKVWDPLYDLAKTKHSLNGHNFIRRNLFTLGVNRGDMSFDLNFDQSHPAWRKYSLANNEFIEMLDNHPGFQRMKELCPQWKEQLLFDEAMHFVADSACRLVDYTERDQAVAAYLVGVVLLNNFMQQQGAVTDVPLCGKAGEWQVSSYLKDLPVILDGRPVLVPYSGIAGAAGDLVSGSALRKEAGAVDTYLMHRGKESVFLSVWGEYFKAIPAKERDDLVGAVNVMEPSDGKEAYLKLITEGYAGLSAEERSLLADHKNALSPLTAKFIGWIMESGSKGPYPGAYQAAESLVKYQADMLAEEIALIHEGDVGPAAVISSETARGTRVVGVGGRMTQGNMGNIFFGELNAELENASPGLFRVIPVAADSADMGIAGAGILASTAVLRRASEKAGVEDGEKPRCIVSIDVGGTKVALAGQVIDDNNKVTGTLIGKQEHSIDFRAGPEEYYGRIAQLIKNLRTSLQREGYAAVDVVEMGHLGHKQRDGTIIPGTITSFGQDGLFEGLDPAAMLKGTLRSLGIDAEVEWNNDALAQGSEALRRAMQDPVLLESLKGERIVYFGLGTGLGSMFLNIGIDGQVESALPAEIHSDDRILKYDLNGDPEILDPDKIPSGLFEFGRNGLDIALRFFSTDQDVPELKSRLEGAKGVERVEWQGGVLTVTCKDEVVRFHPRGVEINERHGLIDRFYVKAPVGHSVVAVKKYHRDVRDTAKAKKGPVYVLGVGRNSHDSSAALIKDGVVIGAIEEERLNLNKHTHAYFPKEATKYLLKAHGITWEDIDHVAVMWDYNSYRDTPHSLSPYRHFLQEHGLSGTQEELTNKYNTDRLQAFLEGMSEHYGTGYIPPVTFVKHHKAHAEAAWIASGFTERTLVATIDGRGEDEATTIWLAENGSLKKIMSAPYVHSLGMLYEIVTKYLGFKRHDEGKVMGFAPYGAPRDAGEEAVMDELRGIMKGVVWFNKESGKIEMNLECFNYAGFTSTENLNFSGPFLERLARIVPVAPGSESGSRLTPENRRYAHLAFALQERIEQVITDMITYYLTEHPETKGAKHLVLSGGIALNIMTNGRLIEKGVVEADKIFVPAYPADDGAPIGAALSVAEEEHGLDVKRKDGKISLGREYSDEEIREVLARFGLVEGEDYEVLANDSDIVDRVAGAVMSDKTVAWFQGGSELGPRALGNRSILNRLDDPEGNLKVNRIKGREPWRPSAMSIQEERAAEFLEGIDTSPFMTIAFPVRSDKKSVIKAGAHPADGTTRPQTVSRASNPLYWSLLEEMGRRSGVPGVLNTSFNRIGPIVETPEDALNTFFYGDGLDLLSIGHFWVKRKAGLAPSIINARDEGSLKDALNKAISDGYPQSASWDVFWDKANALAASRGSDNQHYLIVYTDDNGKEREIIRVPLIKEMFQDGSKQMMIASLANRIQRELPDAPASVVAIETTAKEYAGVVTDLFRQFTPAELRNKWDIVKFGCETANASEDVYQVKNGDADQIVNEISGKVRSWQAHPRTKPVLVAITGFSDHSRKAVARGLSGVCHIINAQRWTLDKGERHNGLAIPFSSMDFNGFVNVIERLKDGETVLIPMKKKISDGLPARGFALLSEENRKKCEPILVKKNSKVWVRHDGHLFEQVVPEASDVFAVNSSFSVNYPVLRKAFSEIYSVYYKSADIIQAKIAAQIKSGDYETPIDFTGLNEYLDAIPMDEARDLFFDVDLLIKKNGMARSDVQVRYMFLKLLTKGRDDLLDASLALPDSLKQSVRDVAREDGWMYAYVAAAIYHGLVKDGSIRDIKKKRLLNAPKILFVSPVRPTAKDDKYGHYIGAGFFRFQQTSQIIAASYLDIFGLEAEVFDLSLGDKEVDRLKESIDDRTSVITLRLNGPITQADIDTIFMLDETIKDKFADGERKPVLMAGGRSAAFRGQELLEATPIKAIFRGLSETDMVNIACNSNFERTRSVESFRGMANVYTDGFVKPQPLKRRKLLALMQLETSFAVADFRKVNLRECWKDLPKGNLHPQTMPFAQPSILLFTGYPDVCTRGCEFCHYYLGGEASLRVSPEAAVDLIKRIIEIYPEVKLFNITDGDMLADRGWIEKFADCFERDALKEKGIKFLAYACVSSCKDGEYLKMLKNRLNIETITFGEEVASVELLKDMKKLKAEDDPSDLVTVPVLAMRSGIPYVRTTFILYYPTITQAQLMDSVRMITDFTERGFNVSVNPYVLPRPPAPLTKSKKAETLTVSYPLPNGKHFTLEHIFVPNDELIARVAERSIAGLRGESAAILKESGWQELEALGWKDSMAEVPPQVEVLALVRQTIKNLLEMEDCQVPKEELEAALGRINSATRNFMSKAVEQAREQASRQERQEPEFEERQRSRAAEVMDAVKIWNSAHKKAGRAKIIAVEVNAWGDSGYETKASDFMQALQHLVNSMKPDGVVEDVEIVVANSSKGLADRVADAKRRLKISDENIDIAILATEETIISSDLKDLRSERAFLAYIDKDMIKESCMDIMLPETVTALVRKLTGFMGVGEINAQFKGILTIELDMAMSRALGVAIYRIIPNAKKLDITEFERIFNLQTREIESQA